MGDALQGPPKPIETAVVELVRVQGKPERRHPESVAYVAAKSGPCTATPRCGLPVSWSLSDTAGMPSTRRTGAPRERH